ncbi:hypothetical protein X798_03704 [Onchocerca flexuosa]|uniref:Uncharacterized protein n=1 Tax=Onchocerca flexuosa TaxID=387005 RepID=A0A238BVR6_9BILA|nr:hypothetical protein X798_03704 [Onchocerca flexuosa]
MKGMVDNLCYRYTSPSSYFLLSSSESMVGDGGGMVIECYCTRCRERRYRSKMLLHRGNKHRA